MYSCNAHISKLPYIQIQKTSYISSEHTDNNLMSIKIEKHIDHSRKSKSTQWLSNQLPQMTKALYFIQQFSFEKKKIKQNQSPTMVRQSIYTKDNWNRDERDVYRHSVSTKRQAHALLLMYLTKIEIIMTHNSNLQSCLVNTDTNCSLGFIHLGLNIHGTATRWLFVMQTQNDTGLDISLISAISTWHGWPHDRASKWSS